MAGYYSDDYADDGTVDHLNGTFSRVRSYYLQASRKRGFDGPALKECEADYCYLIDEIQRGPVYIRHKRVQDANDLINSMREIAAEHADSD